MGITPLARAASAPPYPGRPLVRTFRSRDILSAGPVRCFAQTRDGNFFAGSESLSVFDGSVWSSIDGPDLHGIRALADERPPAGARSERVWVAARTTLGYVERNEIGKWRFVSLRAAALAAGPSAAPPFFDVADTDRGALFATANGVIRWDGRKFAAVALDATSPVKLAQAAGGGAWIWQAESGLCFVDDEGGARVMRPPSRLPPGPITWLLPGESGPSSLDGFVLGTENSVYRLTADGFERLAELSEVVRQQLAVGAAALPGNRLVICTLNNGVVFGTRDGTVTSIVNHLNGLRDDAVHAIWPGVGREAWIGLDDGCQRISGLGRISMFDSREGLERGFAQRVLTFRGNTYIQTNKALYRLQENLGGLTRLAAVFESNPGLTGSAVGREALWVGGYRGIWKVGDGVELTREARQYPVEALCSAPAGAILYYAQDRQVHAIGSLPTEHELPDLDGRVTSMVADLDQGLWLSTEDNVIQHYAPDRQGALQLAGRYADQHGLADASRPRLMAAGKRVFAFTEKRILAWNGAAFEPAPNLGDWIGIAGDSADATTAYWVVCRRNESTVLPYSVLRIRVPPDPRQPVQTESIRCIGLDSIGQVASVSVTHAGGGEWLWIGGKEGLLRMATAGAEIAGVIPKAEIREVHISGAVERSLPIRSASETEIEAGVEHIRFNFSPAEPIDPGSEFYQTRLQNIESDWSEPASANVREFTGLGPGHYVFSVRRVDRFGRIGPAAEYRFHLAAPWYDRWPAELAFAVIGAAGVMLVFRWRVRRLEAQARRLDRLVAERTRALELSNVGRAEFLENISHEIRNPLNGLTGLLRLLDKHAPSANERTIAESLRHAAAELTRIFEQVLNFSKAEYGYVQLERKPFLLQAVIEGAMGLLADAARQRGCTFRFEWPKTIEDGFDGDGDKIGAIATNLLSNAIKYAPGEITVTVACEPGDAESCDVLIEVADRGPGIPPEEQELIFEKFVRGSKAKRELVPGTGLGLALCRAYAQMMGGSIHVDSQPGGSVFSVQIPLARRQPGQGRAAPAIAPILATAGKGSEGQRVALVVEDELYNRLVLKSLIENAGWTCQTAETVEEGRRLLGERVPDVVLLDLELPDGSGVNLAREIRSRCAPVPAMVATTAHDSDEMRAVCRDAGIDAFLSKPYSPEDVGRILGFTCTTPLDVSGISAAGFMQATEEEIARLERAVETSDPAAKRFATHRLRALAGLVGSPRLKAGVQEIEQCDAANPGTCRLRLAALKEIWQQERSRLAV